MIKIYFILYCFTTDFTTLFGCPNRIYIQGVQKKLCFFTIHCNPSLAYIAVRDLLQALNAMRVYSHSYWLVIFCTANSSRVLAREMWQTFENSWKKTQYLMNTLYIFMGCTCVKVDFSIVQQDFFFNFPSSRLLLRFSYAPEIGKSQNVQDRKTIYKIYRRVEFFFLKFC